jgi:predicted phage terminase large subunit-like protein
MLNVIEAPPPDKDKVSRVNAVAPIIESGRVKLIDGIYITDFLDECATFPNGQHDDQIDTLTMLLSNNNKSFLNQYV